MKVNSVMLVHPVSTWDPTETRLSSTFVAKTEILGTGRIEHDSLQAFNFDSY